MASAYSPDLRLRAQAIERNIKLLINESLKQICRNEGLQVSGLKNQLQTRIINKLDQLVVRGDVEGVNRLDHAVKHNGRVPSNSGGYISSSPPAPPSSSRMSNGYAAAAHGSPFPGANKPESKVTWKNTPFFEVIKPLTATTEFPKLEGHRQQLHIKLSLTEDTSELLRTDTRYRVMLYSAGEPIMGQGYGAPHDVSFPQNIEVKVNHSEDVRWNHKGLKNKPGSAQPGDLTAFLRKQPGYLNDIGVMYALTSKKFYMNAMLVKKSTPEDLTKQLKTKPVISKSRVIREMLAKAADPDIEAVSTNMSLKDPISMLRMTMPIRSTVCTHNQCFDAFTFLDMQQQGPTWTCPICSKPVSFVSLHIDEYVQDILQQASTLDQVTLDPDGKWRPVVEKTDGRNGGTKRPYDDDDDSDDLVEISDYRPIGLKAETPATPFSFGQTPPQYSPAPGSAARINGSGGAGSKRRSEVIDLTLSDGEDEPPAKRPHLQPSASSSSFQSRVKNGFPPPSTAPNGVPAFALPNNTSSSRPSDGSFSLSRRSREPSGQPQPSHSMPDLGRYGHNSSFYVP